MRRPAVVLSLALTTALTGCSGDSSAPQASGASGASQTPASGTSSSSDPTSVSSQSSTFPTAATAAASDTTFMQPVRTYAGGLTAKSVDASGTGLVIANNMIYKHTMTLFDAPTGQRIAEIPDEIDLQKFGLSDKPLKLTGGPVEAVWSHDGAYVYVSNYVMHGEGFNDEPNDLCTGKENYRPSYVYRVNVRAKAVDEVIAVGAVPKYVALTPDGKNLLVSNWCSYSFGVVDLATKKMVKNIPVARWPRGIATSPKGTYAYVAAFGTDKLYRVNLVTGASEPWVTVGKAARHVVTSPDHRYLYVVASQANTVTKIELETGRIVGKVTGLREPRSMTISPDGKALYVVNYTGQSVTKIDAATMERRQVVITSFAWPIGITYEPKTGQVWVSNYDGTIDVFDDNSVGTPPKEPLRATAPAGAQHELIKGGKTANPS